MGGVRLPQELQRSVVVHKKALCEGWGICVGISEHLVSKALWDHGHRILHLAHRPTRTRHPVKQVSYWLFVNSCNISEACPMYLQPLP